MSTEIQTRWYLRADGSARFVRFNEAGRVTSVVPAAVAARATAPGADPLPVVLNYLLGVRGHRRQGPLYMRSA